MCLRRVRERELSALSLKRTRTLLEHGPILVTFVETSSPNSYIGVMSSTYGDTSIQFIVVLESSAKKSRFARNPVNRCFILCAKLFLWFGVQ